MSEAEYLSYMTRQRKVNALLEKEGCDSPTLRINKFPYIIPDGVSGKEKIACAEKRQDELKEFCGQVSKLAERFVRSKMVPEIPGSLSFTAQNKGRLLVNHTGGIVENSNLSLHRFFCYPTIPGSALKGIARNAARFDEDQKRFSRIFGGIQEPTDKKAPAGKTEKKKGQAGSVEFLMAVPEKGDWKLVVDVLTSHGGSDTKNPVPVFFPAVEKGATFLFTVAPTARTEEGDLEFAVKYLKLALAENGVGAKTAAGYGWFEIEKELSEEDETAIVKSWGILELPDKLQEIADSNSTAKQRCYLERMIKEKKSLIRKWENKGSSNFDTIRLLAEKCGMELPE